MGYDPALVGNCILSAEDNEVNQIVLEHTLAEQELPVVIVGDGAQAVAAWRELKPLLILMDISMPVQNGLDATREIRGEEAGTGLHVPIVALTAHALKGDEEKCIESGADYYLTKPINPDVLLKKVAEIIKRTSSSDVAAAG